MNAMQSHNKQSRYEMRSALTIAGLLALGMGAAAPTARADVALPPFYEAVTKMSPDGKLGQVVKREKVTTSIAGAQAWRIAYISSDAQERKTLSTALVVAPVGSAPKEGRPVIAWAHGTTGTAQSCGPSQMLDPAKSLNQYFLVGGDSWSDYGLPSVEAFIKEGYVVVGTDYQGLGGGGRHQYSVAVTNGRDVINSVRAAGSMKETGGGRKAVVYGWSQGGGATLGAASLTDYIARKGTALDGVEFLGFVAMAPDDVAAVAPKEKLTEATAERMFGQLVTTFSDNIFNFTHFAMFAWATQAAFPNLQLTDVFTDDGAKAIDEIMSKKCVHATADTMSYTFGADYKALVRPVSKNALAWAGAFIRGSVVPVKPAAPVVIYWGTKDTVVPPAMGQAYREQMCQLGGNVARVQLDGEQTHFSTPAKAAPLYVAWIKDRVAGKSIADGCKAGG
jgi:pimeloyl-ACP methyl ester carboxylesterase